MLVLPADHVIRDKPFRAAVDEARKLAEAGWLVAFGIGPASPETGFGYGDVALSRRKVGLLDEAVHA